MRCFSVRGNGPLASLRMSHHHDHLVTVPATALHRSAAYASAGTARGTIASLGACAKQMIAATPRASTPLGSTRRVSG